MSIVLDPAEPVAFQPRGEEGPTYFLRVPKVVDRGRYRHALQTAGAVRHSNLALMQVARAGLTKLLPGEDGDDGRALIDAYVERLTAAVTQTRLDRSEEAREELLEALRLPEALVDLLNVLGEHDTSLRKATADNVVYRFLAGMEAAKLFLTGWEGEGLPPFKRNLSGPTEETLQRIPSGDFEAIGGKVEDLMEPTEARMGNSGSASSGQPTPSDASSDGTNTPPKARSKAEPKTVTA